MRNKPYTVSITINEEEEEIIDLICHDCPAAKDNYSENNIMTI